MVIVCLNGGLLESMKITTESENCDDKGASFWEREKHKFLQIRSGISNETLGILAALVATKTAKNQSWRSEEVEFLAVRIFSNLKL